MFGVLAARTMAALFIAFVYIGAWPGVATAQPANPKEPNGYVLVDNDTGKVLAGKNERALLPPASTTKLLTALVANVKISDDAMIAIDAKAASMPAMRMGLVEGERWSKKDLLRSLLMVSANDAAVALAHASSGDLNGFARDRQEAAQRLGLRDSPVLNDPSGLDDEFSHNGGDLVSPLDMAIVARAALADPVISEIVQTSRLEFVGGDGRSHVLNNHNLMLKNYTGANGMKTGYTSKAKHTFVGSATREGRTMIAVVMGADNPYAFTKLLLDRGFSTPTIAQQGAVQLSAPVSLRQPAPVETPVADIPIPSSRSTWTFISYEKLVIGTALAFLAIAVVIRARSTATTTLGQGDY